MQHADAPQGHVSADGLWRWDGTQWLSTSHASTARPRRAWLAIAGGITALVALPVVLAACVLPFVYWSDATNGATASIFNLGFSGGAWYAVEPVGVMFGAIPAAVVLMAWNHRVARAVASGVLLAFGLQTIGLFTGYTFGDLSFGRIGPAGPVGALGGVLLFAAGGLGLGSLFSRA